MTARITQGIYEALVRLPEEDRDTLINALIRFQLYGEKPNLPERLVALWILAENGTKKARTSAENGKKGGRPRGSKNRAKATETPKLEDVEQFIKENDLRVSADEFFAYYERRKWKIGNEPIRSWKALCRTWSETEENERDKLMKMLKA